MTTKICATSDLHGHLPEIPQCDLLLIAGDVCPPTNHKPEFQRRWLRDKFDPWLAELPVEQVVMTWGNHDWVGMLSPRYTPPLNGALVLIDDVWEVCGQRIWGSPWTLEFCNWAFNATEKELRFLHSLVPPCDIIVTHGPPYGFGDTCPDGRKVGSPALATRIDVIQPKLVVYGHIHSGQGTYKIGNSIVANVAHVNEEYRPCYPPQVFEID